MFDKLTRMNMLLYKEESCLKNVSIEIRSEKLIDKSLSK